MALKVPRRIFLAPRSNETSFDNLKSTIKNGVPYAQVEPFLDATGKNLLSGDPLVYAWGNQESKEGAWSKMQNGDLVLFYSKGSFVFSGRCVHKQKNEELSDKLWPRSSRLKNKPWSCVFFLKDLQTIDLSLTEINELGGYNFPAIFGFQSLRQSAVDNILEKFGSLENFIMAHQTGITKEEFTRLRRIAKNAAEPTASDIAFVDKLVSKSSEQDIEAEWQTRNKDLSPGDKEVGGKRVQRCIKMAKELKEKRGNCCQIESCRFTFKKKDGTYYCEAAHILPIRLRKKGIDVPSNILILCPNHHKILDYGNATVLSRDEIQIDGKIEKIVY